MLKPACLFLLGLTACTIEPVDSDHEPGPRVVLYDDGTVVRVTACPNPEMFGCTTASGDTVTVISDGITRDVPQDPAGSIEDQLLGLLRDGPFALTIPRPADGIVRVTLPGWSTAVFLPDGFAVTQPPSPVVRSAGALAMSYDVLPGATVDTLMVTTCGNRTRYDLFEERTPGASTVTFDAFANEGGCRHAIHVDQTVALDSLGNATGVRIARFVVASEP